MQRLKGISGWWYLVPVIAVAPLAFLMVRYPMDRDSVKVYYHSGPNVIEILKTFNHFRQDSDSRKYEAVKFLVKNMDLHYFVENEYGDKKVAWYSENFDKMRSSSQLREVDDSLNQAWSELKSKVTPRKIRDARWISSEFLIEHVNQAFENWDTSQWSRHLTFEQFCEFMLPYKPWQSKPELWLEYYNDIYSKINSSIPDSTSILERLYVLKDTADAWSRSTFLPLGRKMTPVEMQLVRTGDCYYDASLMRSIGISLGMPVSTIYLPNEANASGMHYWNAYLDENGIWRELMDRERISIQTWSLVAPKVFLQYWGKRKESFRHLAEEYGVEKADIPPDLSFWNVVDITDLIIPSTDVEVEIQLIEGTDPIFAYLGVFDDRVWEPVHWGYIENGKALFTNMGHQALYIPVLFEDGNSYPAGDMFILNYHGEIEYPAPDSTRSVDFLVDRVYPVKRYLMNNHSKDLRRAVIEGSNDSLFTSCDSVLYIEWEPKLPREMDPETKYIYKYNQWWGEQKVDMTHSYRYFRYRSASDRECNLGDLELYSINSNKVVPVALKAPGDNPEALFDGIYGEDYLYHEKGSWIWIDMGKPVQLSKIRYIAHDIDPASVQTGDEYRLSIWEGRDWKELFTMKASNKAIPCELHPGGMYLLENLSRFVHSRPFRYIPDKDVLEWW